MKLEYANCFPFFFHRDTTSYFLPTTRRCNTAKADWCPSEDTATGEKELSGGQLGMCSSFFSQLLLGSHMSRAQWWLQALLSWHVPVLGSPVQLQRWWTCRNSAELFYSNIICSCKILKPCRNPDSLETYFNTAPFITLSLYMCSKDGFSREQPIWIKKWMSLVSTLFAPEEITPWSRDNSLNNEYFPLSHGSLGINAIRSNTSI